MLYEIEILLDNRILCFYEALVGLIVEQLEETVLYELALLLEDGHELFLVSDDGSHNARLTIHGLLSELEDMLLIFVTKVI